MNFKESNSIQLNYQQLQNSFKDGYRCNGIERNDFDHDNDDIERNNRDDNVKIRIDKLTSNTTVQEWAFTFYTKNMSIIKLQLEHRIAITAIVQYFTVKNQQNLSESALQRGGNTEDENSIIVTECKKIICKSKDNPNPVHDTNNYKNALIRTIDFVHFLDSPSLYR